MNFKEGNLYKISHDYYNDIKLECSYVEDNTIWFVNFNEVPDLYRLDRKTKKLYQWTSKFQSWDRVENTLEEYGADDLWSKRTGNSGGDGYYSGTNQ
jgi:hypothetical protein